VTIAGPQFFQAGATITAGRFIIPDPLAEEQSPDAIDVDDPLGDQRFTLPANAAAVLFFRRRDPDHRANTGFSPLVGQEGANQRLTIDAIGLHTAVPARHRDRGGIHNVTLDPVFPAKHPIDPEPVQTRLLDDDQRMKSSSSCLCFVA